MKKKISSRFVLLLLVLLALLVTGQGLVSGFVLCVGENGHSAFEQASAGRCAPVQPTCPAEEHGAADACSHDYCGPCQDFSTSDSLYGRTRGDHDFATPLLLPLLAAAPPTPLGTLFVRDLTPNLSPQPPPRPYTALTALRTIVLLN